MKTFTEICRMTQAEVKKYMHEYLKSKNYNIVNKDGFLYAKGTVPVLLLAHMDTVHKETPKEIIEIDGKISSPQGIGGDDRCGIYIIMNLVNELNCSVLLCEDEETGGGGARKFTSATYKAKNEKGEDIKVKYIDELNVNYMLEFDRRGSKDAVFYACDNPKFTDFIEENSFFKKAYGSFSDISTIAPAAKIAAVNLSSGYYNAHMLTEYVVSEEMMAVVEEAKKLIMTEVDGVFEYIKKEYKTYVLKGKGSYYDDYDDDYDYNYKYRQKSFLERPNSLYGRSKIMSDELALELEVIYVDEFDEEFTDTIYGNTKAECWAKFFLTNTDACFDRIVDYKFT